MFTKFLALVSLFSFFMIADLGLAQAHHGTHQSQRLARQQARQQTRYIRAQSFHAAHAQRSGYVGVGHPRPVAAPVYARPRPVAAPAYYPGPSVRVVQPRPVAVRVPRPIPLQYGQPVRNVGRLGAGAVRAVGRVILFPFRAVGDIGRGIENRHIARRSRFAPVYQQGVPVGAVAPVGVYQQVAPGSALPGSPRTATTATEATGADQPIFPFEVGSTAAAQ